MGVFAQGSTDVGHGVWTNPTGTRQLRSAASVKYLCAAVWCGRELFIRRRGCAAEACARLTDSRTRHD